MSSSSIRLAPLLALLALTPACRTLETDTNYSAVVNGTPEAVGVLRFLNDPRTTFAVLDDDVPLPSNAAANLIAHRDGPDGVPGTGDDDLFDDIDEILAVRQIGPARLEALVSYAGGAGFTPTGDDILGVWDDVTFSAGAAEATLALVNTASETLLDDDIALDRRAVDSILEARPIETIAALSALYFVGPSALLKLKAWATSGTLAGAGEDCSEAADCEAGLACVGIPHDGSPEVGKCADTSLPGDGGDCAADGDCQPGMACAGLTIYGGAGYCRPLWMFGTYVSSGGPVAIPDGDPAGASLEVVVYGLATVPEDLMVTLDIEHPRPADLVVRLESTNGSDSSVWTNEADPGLTVNAWGIERDNSVNNRLTLRVVDTVSGEAGILHGFSVWVSSRYD